MNYLDIVLAIPLLWAVYKGIKKGLIFQLATLIGLVLGVWAGIHFSDFVSDKIAAFTDSYPDYLPLLSFCVSFIVVLLLVLLLGKLVEKFVKAVALSLLNRILGAAFSVMKMAFILSVILVLLESANRRVEFFPEEAKASSLLYSPIYGYSLWLVPAIQQSNLLEQVQNYSGEISSE